jgi:ankyrin repeat protein
MVSALLRGGAAVNVRTNGGRSALDEALDRGDADLVQMLLGAGAEQRKP